MCLTFAGDEAGDASFAFDKGASTHFVLALIATAQPDALRQALARVRDKRGLPAGYDVNRRPMYTTHDRLMYTTRSRLMCTIDDRPGVDHFRSVAAC
jgi:hypothetical protein